MRGKELTAKLNTIPIVDVAALLGVTLPNRRGVRCPLPDHNDKNPSFQVRPSGLHWVCYGCNNRGGSIDFVKEYMDLSFIDAKNLLNKLHFNVNGPSNSKNFNGGKIKIPPPTKTLTNALKEEPADSRLYEAFLEQHPLLTSGKAYLLGRMISEATIEKFKVGQAANIRTAMNNLIDQFGFDRVKKSGLLTSQSVNQNWSSIFYDGSLIFPYLEEGKVIYYQSRILNETSKGSRWRNLSGRNHRLYNTDSLQESYGSIAICEGVIDTLSAIEIGYSAIGLMGVGANFSQENILSLIGRNVDVLLDWDEKGEARSAQLVRKLKSYGIAAVRKKLGDKNINDLNDFLVKARS